MPQYMVPFDAFNVFGESGWSVGHLCLQPPADPFIVVPQVCLNEEVGRREGVIRGGGRNGWDGEREGEGRKEGSTYIHCSFALYEPSS